MNQEKKNKQEINEKYKINNQESERKQIIEISSKKSNSNAKKKIEFNEKKAKDNLFFEIQSISIFRIYCHLSYSFEIFLTICAIICSLAAGLTSPISCLLTGTTTSIGSELAEDKLKYISEQDKEYIFANFEKKIDRQVKLFLFIGTGTFFAHFLSTFLWEYSSLRQLHHFKEKYFSLLLHQEQSWFDSNNIFQFSSKVQSQIQQIELGLGENIGNLIESTSNFIGGLVIAFITNWKITLIVLTVAPFLATCTFFMINSTRGCLILGRKAYETAGGVAEEILYNIKTVASFAHFNFEKKRFNKLVEEVERLNNTSAYKLAFFTGLVTFFNYITYTICLFYCKHLFLRKNNTTKSGDLMTIIWSTGGAISSFSIIAPNIGVILETCISASDYFTLLDKKPTKDMSKSILKINRDEIKGRIEFKDVSFNYSLNNEKKNVLNKVNLFFEPGKKIALVGESGCGKSTIVNLIERLYDINEGEILIDGINIKEYNLEYLRSLIGYVQQEPVLFNISIRDNIIFGRENFIKNVLKENINELIKKAAKESFSTNFIDKFNEKYEYIVGLKGSKLSGGQKQRIAIARAILCNPKILILDEATSALDNKSEKIVQKALDYISKKNVTTIVIAHRLSTIEDADVIYTFKDGQVIEKGNHKELIEKNGYYCSLIKDQLNNEDKKNNASLKIKKKSNISENNVDSDEEDIIAIEPKKVNKPLLEINRGRVFAFFKDRKLYLVSLIFISIFSGLVSPLHGLNISSAINVFSSNNFDKIKKQGTLHAILYIGIAIYGFIFVSLKIAMFRRLGNCLERIIREKILDKYLNLHMSYFDLNENVPGALLSKLSIDSTQLHVLILWVVGDSVQAATTAISGFVIGVLQDYRIMLIALCFVPFIVISRVISTRTKQSGKDSYRKMNIEAGGILSECLISTKTIFSFNYQEEAVKMYLNVLEKTKKEFLKDSILKGILIGIGFFLSFANKATLYHFSSYYIIRNSMKFENMTICISTSYNISDGCAEGMRGLVHLLPAKKAFDSIFRTLDYPIEIDITENKNKNKISAKDIKGKIEFRNVTFEYPTKKEIKVLNNINFIIDPGKAAALVGYSGCGKSTIIQLIERFYDVEDGKGEILIDDINIKNYNLIELRKNIGLVSQEPILFKRSVFENIKYGDLNANEEQIYEAAIQAHIEKFFNDEEIGTKEEPVSGGEKQRLAIARIFLKNPKIILLDEATSALDKASENKVQESINDLLKNRTSVTVAHRLSTIVNSDIIFVIDNGKVIEKGKNEELLNLKKVYYDLYKLSNLK